MGISDLLKDLVNVKLLGELFLYFIKHLESSLEWLLLESLVVIEATQYRSCYRIKNDVVFGQVDFDKLVLNLVNGRGHSTFEILTLRLFLQLFSLKIFLVLLSDEQSTGDTHEQQFVREVASNDTEEEL